MNRKLMFALALVVSAVLVIVVLDRVGPMTWDDGLAAIARDCKELGQELNDDFGRANNPETVLPYASDLLSQVGMSEDLHSYFDPRSYYQVTFLDAPGTEYCWVVAVYSGESGTTALVFENSAGEARKIVVGPPSWIQNQY